MFYLVFTDNTYMSYIVSSRWHVVTMCFLLQRDAFRRVQSIRFCISLNENFEAQLMEYELICKARHTVHTNSATPSLGKIDRSSLPDL